MPVVCSLPCLLLNAASLSLPPPDPQNVFLVREENGERMVKVRYRVVSKEGAARTAEQQPSSSSWTCCRAPFQRARL